MTVWRISRHDTYCVCAIQFIAAASMATASPPAEEEHLLGDQFRVRRIVRLHTDSRCWCATSHSSIGSEGARPHVRPCGRRRLKLRTAHHHPCIMQRRDRPRTACGLLAFQRATRLQLVKDDLHSHCRSSYMLLLYCNVLYMVEFCGMHPPCCRHKRGVM